MPYYGFQYPLYYPQYISGYERVRMTTTTRTNTMETEQHISKRIVIFGAAGDLCKRKLIPALYQLWCKGLLPQGLLIVGASRRSFQEKLGCRVWETIQKNLLTGWTLSHVIWHLKIV